MIHPLIDIASIDWHVACFPAPKETHVWWWLKCVKFTTLYRDVPQFGSVVRCWYKYCTLFCDTQRKRLVTRASPPWVLVRPFSVSYRLWRKRTVMNMVLLYFCNASKRRRVMIMFAAPTIAQLNELYKDQRPYGGCRRLS
jgi:hypothetical protein